MTGPVLSRRYWYVDESKDGKENYCHWPYVVVVFILFSYIPFEPVEQFCSSLPLVKRNTKPKTYSHPSTGPPTQQSYALVQRRVEWSRQGHAKKVPHLDHLLLRLLQLASCAFIFFSCCCFFCMRAPSFTSHQKSLSLFPFHGPLSRLCNETDKTKQGRGKKITNFWTHCVAKEKKKSCTQQKNSFTFRNVNAIKLSHLISPVAFAVIAAATFYSTRIYNNSLLLVFIFRQYLFLFFYFFILFFVTFPKIVNGSFSCCFLNEPTDRVYVWNADVVEI